MNSFCGLVFILILFGDLSYAERDFYAILNVRKLATQIQIKKAYRKLAKELHPDKNKGDLDTSIKFQDLGAAYEVLSHPAKRQLYDKCGEKCLKKEQIMEKSEEFNNFFGDFGFHFGSNEDTKNEDLKGDNILMDLYVTLEELYKGEFVEIVHNKLVLKYISGTKKCNCRNRMITTSVGQATFQIIEKTICDECPNVKLVNEAKFIDIEIERGMPNGYRLYFAGEGEPHLDGIPGDLYIIIKEIPHYKFVRFGDDLFTNVSISLQDALIGFDMEILHLDGHKFIIKRNEITWPGARIQILGKGMPNHNNNQLYGNLYITFDITFPVKDLLQNEKDEMRKILNQNSINTIYNGIGLLF